MALHTEEIVSHQGMVKDIDEGALPMLYDNLQRSQYKYPIKSTVRELVSNGIDSINERNYALAILNGTAKEDEFYYTGGNKNMDESISENKGVYKDSKFNPEYYDPKFLDATADKVNVIYQERGPLERDLLRVIDKGVGLGGNRLMGYMKLGYSTKRLAKRPLGKFGLGAKVGLSTGVKYFTAISTYNGERFVFNIYSTHAESIVPPFNIITGVKNKEYKVEKRRTIINAQGEPEYEKYFDVFFSEPSEEFNGLEVQLEVKKHNKQEVINAVQNQLLYFSNVELDVHYHAGEIQSIPVQAEILYEDELIVISDNTQFSKPHILINGISYGYIDFLELETEEKQGNIGIKVSPEEIEVVPSREEVIWNEITGNTIRARFSQVVDIASKFVSDQLVEDDFLKWLRLCSASLSGSYDTDRYTDKRTKVMAVLAQIADITELRPSYTKDPTIKYSNQLWTLMPNVVVQYLHKEAVYKNGNNFHKVGRKAVSKLGEIGDLPIFFKDSRTSVRKDMFLLTVYPSGFITIQDKELIDLVKDDETLDMFDKLDTAPLKVNKMLELVKASVGVLNYQEVEVPEGFSIKEPEPGKEEEEEETLMSDDGKVFVSAKDRRKLEGKIVVHTPRAQSTNNNYQFDWHKMEVVVSELEKLDDLELYYASQDYEELLNIAASLTAPLSTVSHQHQPGSTANWGGQKCNSWFDGSNARLIKVSKQNERYMGDNHAHITTFFSKFRNGIITMSNLLIQWNTARLVHQHISDLSFMTSYKPIDANIALRYSRLKNYHDLHFRENPSTNSFDSITSHLDRVTELQLFAHQNPEDAEGISFLAKSLFNQDPNAANIKGAVGYDLEIYEELFSLVEYAKPLKTMLNMVNKLIGYDSAPLTLEEEQTIKSYVTERVS